MIVFDKQRKVEVSNIIEPIVSVPSSWLKKKSSEKTSSIWQTKTHTVNENLVEKIRWIHTPKHLYFTNWVVRTKIINFDLSSRHKVREVLTCNRNPIIIA
uniref:Uncharacterized protein n=1 Tax=Cacopsylla melanoneura TaxID=428564 RepID=A0A8D8ZCX3_9HEMI